MQPLVSVILPVFNAQNFVAESIKSILTQDYMSIELVIVNDGSTDGSLAEINKFKDPRIKLINFTANTGLINALNCGFSAATGHYIARMDADDIALPYRISEQVKFLQSNADIGLCGSFAYILKNNKLSGLWRQPVSWQDIKCSLLFYACLIHPTVMFRASIFSGTKYIYDENYKHAEDYELWCRLQPKIKMANINRPFLKYRWHDSQVSSAFKKVQSARMRDTMEKYFRVYFEDSPDFFLHYLDVAIQQYSYNTTFLHRTIEVFNYIELQNKKHKWFDETILHHRLSEVFFSVCTHFESKKIPCKTIYFKSGYSNLKFVDKWLFLKFLFK